MNNLFAMRRANGDWFALDDQGRFRVPVFRTAGAAMIARSRETRMECFRPIELDPAALASLTTTDQGKACYWLISDPLMKLGRGRPLERNELEQFMKSGEGKSRMTGAGK